MIINVNIPSNSYDIILEKGCLSKAGELLNLNRKVMVVTDDGVPSAYATTIAQQAKEAYIHTIKQGEEHKTLSTYSEVLADMLAHGFTRGDCVVAVGGGVVGDLSGFVAASYMRGVDFYNCPTTVLSQVDSSIGGKTAVNLDTIKNIVGAFYQPKRVLIDINTHKTLPQRQISNGLIESVKMGLTSDASLFELFENDDIASNIETIIEKSLRIKKSVVEEDEKEQGLRKILNFGHTIGHGIEATSTKNDTSSVEPSLYHGEAVAMGMLPMSSEAVRQRLIKVIQKLNIPTSISLNPDEVYEALLHDKKASSDSITIVTVDEPGSFKLNKVAPQTLRPLLEGIIK